MSVGSFVAGAITKSNELMAAGATGIGTAAGKMWWDRRGKPYEALSHEDVENQVNKFKNGKQPVKPEEPRKSEEKKTD